MKRFYLFLTTIIALLFFISCGKKRSGKPLVLVFTKTVGYVHESIPAGVAAIEKLGAENSFDVDTTSNADYFNNDDSLKKYAAVIFLSTTGNVLDTRQEAAFERYIQAGGGFAGIHSATDTEYDWGWYGRMVGGYFLSHPPGTQQAKFIIKDKDFEATKFFSDTIWMHTDELYNFKKLNPDVHTLITVDETSYKGGVNGNPHPMSWYHDYDGGRAFYTALGHTDESYKEENFLKHLLGGIQYAIGKNEELDYSKAKSQYPPEEERFTKTTLSMGEFFEPTEMTILPNFDVLIAQRRGEIMLYKNDTKKVKQVGFLNVYFRTDAPGVNAEEGVLGMAKDPNYVKNNWVYIYYSPADTSVNRLSRFTFKNDTLDLSTEKHILDVWSQRNICCHTGGSIAFGPDGLLYVSTGDNSTPFDEPKQKYVNSGFAPLNDAPGHLQYDARRSAGNTNDLRGKILRLKINDDGSYEIPDGNLFAKGTDKTRPEIYVMGNRNPYRISVDQKNSYLYWGEVGPDSQTDSLDTRGPRGYDEVNQARKAGFFGWPLFVGNNYAYRKYDYTTGQSGEAFDPAHPVNDSRNNTGIKDLPPANPAFIWYPGGMSADFPQVTSGGRTAMAGPVYYTDMYPKETRLPDYYNGKLIIYDWVRGWMKAVTMLPNGDFDKMEPFFGSAKLNALIDMEVGPDGRIYLLEYGSGWFSKNADAGLFRIDYNYGNIAPKIASASVDKTSGNLPFTVKASVKASDPDNGKLSYIWTLGDGTTKETTTPELEYTFSKAGDYKIAVEVKDNDGGSIKQDVADVYAGNEQPVVSIELTGGNKSFYIPGVPFSYKINVKDDDANIDPANFYVSANYKAPGTDQAETAGGHPQTIATNGKNVMLSLDCKTCHKEAETSIGPAFVKVSEKYSKRPDAASYLSNKIMNGSKGVWGEAVMPAHPALAANDLNQVVSWILSLSDKNTQKKSLPAPEGSYTPTADAKPGELLVLSASYMDKGNNGSKALQGSNSLVIPSNYRSFTTKDETKGFATTTQGNNVFLRLPDAAGWFAAGNIDLTGIKTVTIIHRWRTAPSIALAYEVRLDAEDGKVIGAGTLPVQKKDARSSELKILLSPVEDKQMHKLYFVLKTTMNEPVMGGVSQLLFNAR